MSTGSADESNPLTPDDLAAFIRKFDKWAESLPEAEQPIAQLLVQRAREIQLEHVQPAALPVSLTEAIRTAFEQYSKQGGEIWIKGAPPSFTHWLMKIPVGGSDVRLKHKISKIGSFCEGIGLYRYRYRWSDTEYVGVMAQEVARIRPDAVTRGADGFLRVDYARLGTRLMTWAEWLASQEQENLMRSELLIVTASDHVGGSLGAGK
jgi:hypothetical protein